MKLKALSRSVALCLLAAAPVWAQTPAPAAPAEPSTPPAATAEAPAAAFATTIFAEGNYLGVRTEEVTRENAARYGVSGEPRGAGVREVVKGSPAERAGLRAGDVIVRFDGEPVTSARKLTRLIQESAPEHAARLTVLRGGSEQELAATLSRREPFVSAGAAPLTFNHGDFGDALRLGERLKEHPELLRGMNEETRRRLEETWRNNPGLFAFASSRRIGVSTSRLGRQLAEYFGVSHGVLVNSVEENSPASRAGLRAGDVVTEVDGSKVEDAEDLVRALGAKEEGEVTLTVVRERKSRTVRVTPERRQAPQGMFGPGSFCLVEPHAALAPPHGLTAPLLPAVAPRVRLVAPRAPAAPRVTVVRPGERVL